VKISNSKFLISKQILMFKVRNLNSVFHEKNASEHQKIYSSREGADSPRSFGYKRTRGINK